MTDQLGGRATRKTGILRVGDVPWGTHMCQFYETADDLLDILVPYFVAGLEANEFCMWVTSAPLDPRRAREALRAAGAGRYVEDGRIEILPHEEWYLKGGSFNLQRVLEGWVEKLGRALAQGRDGMRVTGNTAWLEDRLWRDFKEYEAAINGVIGKHPMIAMCTYDLRKCDAAEIMDVLANHEFALIRRAGEWEIVENTERKRVVEELRSSESRYRLLFEHLTSGFAYHEMITEGDRPVDYVFLEVNEAFERQTGLSREAILGKRVTEVIPGIERDPAGWIARYGDLARAGGAAHFEQYAAGLGRWYDVQAYSPVPGRFASIFTDVTERKRQEAEREGLLERERAAREEAEALVQLRERFMAILGHDLRQPLNIIATNAALMLKRGGLDPKTEKSVGLIDRGARRVAGMIADLLDYTRCRMVGGMPIAAAPADAGEIVRRAVDESRAAYPEATIGVEVSGDCRGVWDADRLVQLVCNLVGNGCHHGEKGAPVLVEARDAGDEVVLAVRNRGNPIPIDELPAIFEPFRRGARRPDRSPQGLGLGLSIVNDIARAHGGSASVQSDATAGTVFTVRLPRRSPCPPADAAPPSGPRS